MKKRETMNNDNVTKSQYTGDTPESAALECKSAVRDNKKLFEQSTENSKLRIAPKKEIRKTEADCKAIASDLHDSSNKADATKFNDAKDSQGSTDMKEHESNQVEVVPGRPTFNPLQKHYEQMKMKLSEAFKGNPLLMNFLQTDSFLSTFQQAIETHSTPVETLEDVSERFQILLEMVQDLLEPIGQLQNTAGIVPCLSIVLNRNWIAKQIEDIVKVLRVSNSSFAIKENEFIKKMMKQKNDIRLTTTEFLEIKQENTNLTNFHFGYKISDHSISDCEEPLYFELTDSSHNAKPVVLPRPIMKQDIIASSIQVNTMQLEWTVKQTLTKGLIVDYEIQLKRDGDSQVKTIRVGSETRTYTVGELEEDSGYQFRVVPLCEFHIRLPANEFSDPFKTEKREIVMRPNLTETHEELGMQSAVLLKEQMPTETQPTSQFTSGIGQIIEIEKTLLKQTNGTRRYAVDQQKQKTAENLPEKVLLVVGGTGCGKSTLINAISNYLNNVQFEDAKRYKVITEHDELVESGTCSAGQSKTRFVTAYEFGALKELPYRLTVVDTPGFGDTEGVDKDRRTIGYIKEWFSQEKKKISAVCIVIKYNETRIKPQVQYELHSVISLFGKNVEKNVFMLFTFCDGSTPPTIAALEEMKLPLLNATFNINSSAVLTLPSERNAANEDDLVIAKYYWSMSMASFGRFFDMLKTVKDETLSVSLVVLRKREILDALVRQIPFHVKRIHFLFDVARQINAHREAIGKGLQIGLQITEFRTVEGDGKAESRNCLDCKMTCHKDCGVLDPLTLKSSCLMLVNESSDLEATDIIATNCQVCGCAAQTHQLQNSTIEMKEQRREIAASDVLTIFSTTPSPSSSSNPTSSDALLHRFVEELTKIDMQLKDMLRRIDSIEKDLANASLDASHQKTAVGRLKDEIFSENEAMSTGYEKRIAILEHHQELLGHLAERADLVQYWWSQLPTELSQSPIKRTNSEPKKNKGNKLKCFVS